MVHWQLKEKFDAQDTKFQAIRARYDQAVIEAGTRLADLKAEQEAVFRKEFQTGEDLSGEKARIHGKIAEAEAAQKSAELERVKAHEYARVSAGEDRISVRDLVLNWNGPYLNEIRQTELQPITDRMREARDAYYNSVLDFYETIAEYSYDYQVLRDLAYRDNDKYAGNHMYPHEVKNAVTVANLSNADLMYIEDHRKLPDGVKRTVNGGESK